MTLLRILGCTLLALVLAVPPVLADDPCLADDEKKMALLQVAAMKKSEQSGQPAELFNAYRAVVGNDCIGSYDKDASAKAKANLPKVGRDLAKSAEAKGALYPGHTSAFGYFEAIGDYQEANRVTLKAIQAKPDDLRLFETAWNIDNGRRGPADSKTGERMPYNSPPAFRQELAKVASANADRLMKAEEKDAAGLTGSLVEVGTASMRSLEKLRMAALWMKYLPGGDKSARDRAEQRGDTIMKRSDPTFSQGSAGAYYEFAGTPRAKDKIAQIEKKSQESQRAMEKASEKMKESFTQKSEADQKKFEKKKADLEKELGF